MAVFFKINSKTIKAPAELTCSTEVLDKSERTMDGTMVVDIIGRKRKVEVAWKYLSKEDMGLLTAETKSGSFVTIDYNDPETGKLTSMTARPQDLSCQPRYDWVKGKIMWASVSIAFVER